MAEFQHMNGSRVTSPITTVVGSQIHLKVLPGNKEPMPTIAAAPEAIARATHIDIRKHANFETFRLDAISVGNAKLQASDPASKKALAGPVDVVVEARLTLPDAQTAAGLFVRLFIAELPSPDQTKFSEDEAKTAMTWMRVVVENRLARPSVRWASAGAKNLTDVIRAKNQFEGFSHYPSLAANILKNVTDAFRIANDGNDPRRPSFKMFVNAALTIASLPKVTDPCPTGLFWWRTSGSGSPSSDTQPYQTKLGNTFYTPKP
jgi:hypothetical protein